MALSGLKSGLNLNGTALALCAASVLAGVLNVSAQDNATPGNSTVAAAPQATVPASVQNNQDAGWRAEIGTFKIGLVRGWSSDMSLPALARIEKIFASALQVPVKVVVFERFTSLMDAQADGRIDLAAYSARAFATVQLMCECVDAIAAPSTIDGNTGQVALLIGDQSQIPSATNLTGEKIGQVALSPVAAQSMVYGSLRIGGKVPTGKEDNWVTFPDFAAAISAYHNNEIAAFIMPTSTTLSSVNSAGTPEALLISAKSNLTSPRRAIVLWRSSFWPYGPIAVRNNLAVEAKQIILRTLEQMDVSQPQAHATLSDGLSGPFLKADLASFGPVKSSLRLLVSQNANWR
jgi:phosphonate transport system substrate-binding protein